MKAKVVVIWIVEIGLVIFVIVELLVAHPHPHTHPESHLVGPLSSLSMMNSGVAAVRHPEHSNWRFDGEDWTDAVPSLADFV